MKKPTVSILMATWQRPKFIGRAIESARSQTLQDWELIIVDDGSPDNTAEVVREWQKKDQRIKYIRLTHVGRVAVVSNAGLREAQGEFIAVLDDDDYWIDDRKLEKQVAFLRAHPDYIACGGWFIAVDEHDKEKGRFKKPETDEAMRRIMLYANPIVNSTSMFRREPAGHYDESLSGFADLDFWLALGKKGKLYNFQEYFVAYRVWLGSLTFLDIKRNADVALRLVFKYRHDYPGFYRAFFIMELYRIYGRLPASVRSGTGAFLSRFKKILFAK